MHLCCCAAIIMQTLQSTVICCAHMCSSNDAMQVPESSAAGATLLNSEAIQLVWWDPHCENRPCPDVQGRFLAGLRFRFA